MPVPPDDRGHSHATVHIGPSTAARCGGTNNGLDVLNVPIAEQLMAEGLVIVAAVSFDQFVRREDS